MLSTLLAIYLSTAPTVTISGSVLTPDGKGMRSGRVTCRLSTPGTVMDGGVKSRVGASVASPLGLITGAVSMHLVPNDIIDPPGTYYTCTIDVRSWGGTESHWTEPWQIYSTPSVQDIGSLQVPRYALGACMPAAVPTILPVVESLTSAQPVSLTANTPGSLIYYTVDGGTPTTGSTLYVAPFTIAADTTVKALAAPLLGWNVSDVTSRSYVLAVQSLAVPFTASGTPATEDASAITHVTWNGSAIQDTRSMGWTTVGTPPQVASSTLPCLSCGGGVGPIASGNRYSYGATSDPLDVINFEACISFVPATVGTIQTLVGNGNLTTTGYTINMAASGACEANIGGTTLTTANVAGVGLNVCCFGRTGGTTGLVKLNLGTAVTGTVTSSVDTARAISLGASSSGSQPFTGKLVELQVVPTGISDGWATDWMLRHFGHYGPSNEVLAVTRGAGSAVVHGSSWSFPANVIRATASGAYDTGVTVTAPALPLASWCAAASWQPDSVAWTAADATLWGRGTAAGADSARLRALSGGTLSCEVYDSTATARSATWTHGYAVGSVHVVHCCNQAGTVVLYSDGTQVAAASSGGTGAWSTAPTAETWGAPSTAGWVKNTRTCRGGIASNCP